MIRQHFFFWGAEDEALEQWNELLAEEHMEARWQGGKEDEDD